MKNLFFMAAAALAVATFSPAAQAGTSASIAVANGPADENLRGLARKLFR